MTSLLRHRFITNDAAIAEPPIITADPGPPQIQSLRQFTSTASRSVVTRLMANNFDMRALRTNDLLRKEEWIQLDRALIEMATVRLRPRIGSVRIAWRERRTADLGASIPFGGKTGSP